MPDTVSAFIAIGSNIAPERNIPAAVAGIYHLGHLDAMSTFYSTPPIGRNDQPRYANGVVRVQTVLDAAAIRSALRGIEAALGRARTSDKYAARTIDLDLVLYGQAVIETLDIPDPHIYDRPFLAIPIAQIDESIRLPDSNTSISKIAAGMAVDELIPMETMPSLITGHLELLGLREARG
jgi:2-amino-4-hydroxy-6-hydroxymethyldihydropteridine diphosphokinase